MNIQEIRKEIIKDNSPLEFPLRCDYGRITDGNGNMVADIRGWGWLQYHEKGEEYAAKIQDAIGQWIVETLNKELINL